MTDPGTRALAGVMMLGVAWAFYRADPRSATSRSLVLAMAMGGLATLANDTLIALLERGPLPWWARALVIPEVLAFCAVFEWVQRVRRTIPAGQLRTRFGDGVLRVAQGLAVLYGINGMLCPVLRIRDFFGGLAGPALWTTEVMALFVAPISIALLLWMLSVVLCLNRRPAPAERVRLVAFLVGIPVIAASIVLPPALAPTVTVIGVAIILAGALRHAELRGRQGQFMSRFLSPQVAALVNREGLHAAMREERREVSVVCVDLRGFTAYAATHGSDDVIALLRRYYDAVGAVALEHEGTIKDYAGDGVLVLVGAPVATADHAARAVALARGVMVAVAPVIADLPLGCGIGVASGPVTLGIVGGEGPLEYAAVGSAVNLAARLCEQAAAGEILVAGDTVAALDEAARAAASARDALTLKGFAAPVAAFSVLAGPA